MTTVYLACAKSEEQSAEDLAAPLRAAGYRVVHEGTTLVGDSFVGEAARVLGEPNVPIVVRATARAAGSRWAQKIVNAAQAGGAGRVFVVVMEEDAATDHLALGAKVARYWENPAGAIEELLTALALRFPPGVERGSRRIHEGHFLDHPTEIATFDLEALESFRAELRPDAAPGVSPTMSPWQFLEHVGVLGPEGLTRTGVLLFGTDPTRSCPSAIVKCVRYLGTDRSAARQNHTVAGPVTQQIVQTWKFVADRSQRGERPTSESPQTRPVYDLPMIAVREVIANALVHRDYANATACVHVRLFDNRLEVSSPGDWYSRTIGDGETVDLRDLESQSVKRNFRLAHLLSWIKLVEGEGSGIPTAVSDCAERRVRQPVVRQDGGFVTVTLWRDDSPDKAGISVPRSLPPPVRDFTGRRAALARIDAAYENARQPVVITGIPGIGKTTIALEWATRNRERFPDGQVYVQLSGHTVWEALEQMLRSLGVRPDHVPSDQDELSCLFRTVVATKRVLFIFENATRAEDVLELLPGGQNTVIVTSRTHLPELVAVQGFAAVVLSAFSREEGVAFLLRRAHDAVSEDLELAATVVDLCAGLPLALALMSGQIASGRPMRALVRALSEERHRLGAFAHVESGVRRALVLPYNELGDGAARLFRNLGLHRGPDMSRALALALGGAAELDELHDFHLIDHLGDDRYRMHDLLHLLARELADAHDSDEQQHAATVRMLDYYLVTGHTAAMTLDPHRSPVLEDRRPDATIATYQDAFEWFTAEHRSMLAMVRVAAEQGLDDHAWKLTWTLATYLDRHGHSRDHIDALNVGLAAADRLGDLRVQALLNRLLGHALTRLGRYSEGHRYYTEALRVFCDAGDRTGEAHTCNALSRVCEKSDLFDDALTFAQRAHDLYEQLENRVRQARALNQVGSCQAKLGRYSAARESCELALRLFEEQHDSYYQAVALDSLGYIHHQLGAHETAVTCYRRAIVTYRHTSDDHSAANTLSRLGDAYVTVHDLAAAGRVWREALRVLRALEHPDAEVVEEKIRSVA